MRWLLIKAGCIAGAGIIGALLWGDVLAGVLIAPFGWIVGKTAQVWSEARKVPVPMVQRRDEEDDIFTNPIYDNVPGNIYYDSDILTNPTYSSVPGNIYYDDFKD